MFTIVQFSPTGNAAYLANLLSKYLPSSRVYALEHTLPASLEESQHLIIMYAIHAFNAPKIVQRFVSALPENKFKKISLIGVGCNDIWLNDSASTVIKKMLTDKSYKIVVDEVIAMPLTFILSFPEDIIKAQLENANVLIQTLANNIINDVVSRKEIALKSKVISKMGKIEPGAARLFGLELHAKKSCNKCGLCVRECPENNIRIDEKNKIRFGFKCMMCMRCIYNCPQKSITPRVSKFIPIKNGYSIERYMTNDFTGDQKEKLGQK